MKTEPKNTLKTMDNLIKNAENIIETYNTAQEKIKSLSGTRDHDFEDDGAYAED